MDRRSLFRSSVGTAVAALAMTALCAAPTFASADRHLTQPQSRAAIGNPVQGNDGFTAFVHHDALVASHENEGTMALGGDLVLQGLYNVALHPPTQPFFAPGETVPTGLLIGGKIDWAASTDPGIVRVLSGTLVNLGNGAGTDVLNTGQPTQLVPTGKAIDNPQRVELTTVEPATSVVKPGLIDFDRAFTAYDQRSADMANCPDTVIPTEANDVTPLPQPWPEGAQAYLTLDRDRTNVWTVTKQQLAALSNITLRTLPTASGPLVINVLDDTGEFDWDVTTLANFGDAAAPYVLWNFPTTRTLTMRGGQSLDGTVYAPHARLVDVNSGNIQGDLIIDELEHGATSNGGQIHDFPFQGYVDCEASTPTETPTQTLTPTETLSPTETSTEPTATQTATTTESSQPAEPTPTLTPTCPVSPVPTTTTSATAKPTPRPTRTRDKPCTTLPPTGASLGPGTMYPALGLVGGGAVILGAVHYRRRARKH
jgi:choice-of-anchor A domain-containing protein